jgi:hypothetical protein
LELTKETFDDFVSRLRYHNKGEGVNDHCTRDPIFIVESRKRIYGFDPQYGGDYYVWSDTDDREREADARTAKRLDALDDDGRDTGKWEKVYYQDRWEYVCSHFTKEAAEAFVARKKHDYDELRVYVDCQLYCWEYNAIIEGLLSGKIAFQG